MAITTAIAFASRERHFLSGDSQGEVTVATETGQTIFKPAPASDSPVVAVAAAHGLVMGAEASGRVTVWSTPFGVVVDQFVSVPALIQVVVAGRHRYFGVDNRLKAHRWAMQHGELRRSTFTTQEGKPLNVDSLAVTETEVIALSGFAYVRCDPETLQVVSRTKPVKASQFDYMDGMVGLSSGGEYVFVHWDDLLVFNTRNDRQVSTRPIVSGAQSGALDDKGEQLVVGTLDGYVTVSFATGQNEFGRKVSGHPISAVAITSRGDRVAYLDAAGIAGQIVLAE